MDWMIGRVEINVNRYSISTADSICALSVARRARGTWDFPFPPYEAPKTICPHSRPRTRQLGGERGGIGDLCDGFDKRFAVDLAVFAVQATVEVGGQVGQALHGGA